MLGLRAYSVIVSRQGFECHHCCANNIINSSAVSVTLQLCKQLLFPPLICHIRTYFGGWSWQVFHKYEKHTTAAEPWFETGTSFHWGFLVASPAARAPPDGPKGAAVKIVAFLVPLLPSPHTLPISRDPFPFLLPPFVLTQMQALPPNQRRLLLSAEETYVAILIWSVAEDS